MIFYLCNKYQLAGTQADAKALDREFVQIDIPVDKSGLMAYINDLMRVNAQDMRQSGVYDATFEPMTDEKFSPREVSDLERINRLVASCDGPPPKPAKSLPPVYATVSITIDDEWDKLPLARQLHFAGLALEEARTRISA